MKTKMENNLILLGAKLKKLNNTIREHDSTLECEITTDYKGRTKLTIFSDPYDCFRETFATIYFEEPMKIYMLNQEWLIKALADFLDMEVDEFIKRFGKEKE